MPRSKQQETKRNMILEAYGRCLVRSNTPFISIRQIANESGLPLGSIHYYFKNKDELLIAYYGKNEDIYKKILKEWVDNTPTDIKTFGEFYHYASLLAYEYFDTESSLRAESGLFFYEALLYSEPLREFYKKINHRDAAAIKESLSKTQYQCKNPDLVAYLILAQWEGFPIFCELGTDGLTAYKLFEFLDSELNSNTA